MADSPIPVLPPEEAIRFFEAKGLARSFAWADVWAAQHDFFFTVAKMLSVSLLEDTHGIILEALKDGRSPQQLGKDLKSLLATRGWWGKARQVDPLTGADKLVQLGSNARVRTIVNTNLRTSYSAGRYARQERVKDAFPILVYKSRMDGRERPQHHAWHNVALPIGDPWWRTHYPPCDWGCRCRTVSMTAKMAARRGIEVGEKPPYFGTRKWVNKRTGEELEIEKGIGAGWDYHPGKAVLDGLSPEPLFGFSKIDDGTSIAAAVPSAVEAFLGLFGVGDNGGVWRDATGWPLPISPAWLKGLSPHRQSVAILAARTISRPDSIRLVWVTGKDDRLMLVRRYVGAKFVVDVGAAFWRFAFSNSKQLAKLSTGDAIWSAEAGAIASYNPNQPRVPSGPHGGEFARSAGGSAARMWQASGHQIHDFGPVSDEEASWIRRETGHDVQGFSRVFDTSGARHVKANHADAAREASRNQHAVKAGDFNLIPRVAAEGKVRAIGEPGKRKLVRLEHQADIEGRRYVYHELILPKEKQLRLKTFRIEKI